jgi:hypothetical protein
VVKITRLLTIKNNLQETEGKLRLDVFVLTHPHEDHIQGFSAGFFTGDPDKYSEKDLEDKKIFIEEMWFSPRVFNNIDDLCDDAKAFKKEAERRLKLYRDAPADSPIPGNRILIIGATDEEKYGDLEAITVYPGQKQNIINGDQKEDFEIFVLGPVKNDCDDDSIGPNNTSIVFQGIFNPQSGDNVKVLFTGDAEYKVWERIAVKNEDTPENIEWDLFFTPHHCSWTFFNASGENDPLETSLSILENKREGARIVASSKPIKDDDCNPPSYKARGKYIDFVGKENFICLGENPNEENPEPLEITISGQGITWKSRNSGNQKKAGVNKVYAAPTYYG